MKLQALRFAAGLITLAYFAFLFFFAPEFPDFQNYLAYIQDLEAFSERFSSEPFSVYFGQMLAHLFEPTLATRLYFSVAGAMLLVGCLALIDQAYTDLGALDVLALLGTLMLLLPVLYVSSMTPRQSLSLGWGLLGLAVLWKGRKAWFLAAAVCAALTHIPTFLGLILFFALMMVRLRWLLLGALLIGVSGFYFIDMLGLLVNMEYFSLDHERDRGFVRFMIFMLSALGAFLAGKSAFGVVIRSRWRVFSVAAAGAMAYYFTPFAARALVVPTVMFCLVWISALFARSGSIHQLLREATAHVRQARP